tara:strand:- start:1055 stop:1930 length:876 start_codon:yes stop_codon:yes gene_type:complete
MKESKNIITRLIQKICKKFLSNSFYGFFLFLRFRNKFSRSINRIKSSNFYSKNLNEINNYEFKITSQNNEDGIIDYIFKRIPTSNFFVEIGFGYYEFNSLNLIKNNWSGLLIDQNLEECILLRKLLDFYYPKSNIKIVNNSINKENINKLISNQINKNNIDFFSIDVDGNDYWILKNLDLTNTSCVCLEYNHWLGPNDKKAIPYNINHRFEDNGYFGASLLAFNELMNEKKFKLISVDSSGTNAFFINEKFSDLFEILDPIKSFKSVGRLYSEEQKKKIFKGIKTFNFIDV